MDDMTLNNLLTTIDKKQDTQHDLLMKLDSRISVMDATVTGKIKVQETKIQSAHAQLAWNWRIWMFFLGGSGLAFGMWKAMG